MALLNLLVQRIDGTLNSMMKSSAVIREIQITSIGDVDLTRRLRVAKNVNTPTLDRGLWSTTQVVRFQALLDYMCGDEETSESCMDNAQSSVDEIVHQLESSETTSSSTTPSLVDNEGEDWDQEYVNLPDTSDVGFEIITDRPTSVPPTTTPSVSPTSSRPTLHPSTTSPTSSPQRMQSYSINVEINPMTKEPTSRPTTRKPTSPSAVTENEWFASAGLFVGDASKRFCGFDWADVMANCL